MGVNSYLSTAILENILESYKFPADVFIGSQEQVALLKQALATEGRREK